MSAENVSATLIGWDRSVFILNEVFPCALNDDHTHAHKRIVYKTGIHKHLTMNFQACVSRGHC